jgi:hypothetical protein
MSSSEPSTEPYWHEHFENVTCPKCHQKGDEETGGMFIVLPMTMLHQIDPRVPDDENSCVLLCYACAIEMVTAQGAKMLVEEIAGFAKSLGSRGSKKLPC